MLIPVLTTYEKEHLSERQPLPERYVGLGDDEMDRRISAARQKLGRRLVILGHHYQRDEVIKFADYTGDSYKLAGQVGKHPDAEFIVFCGVHFMAESADVLSAAHQQVILPDLAAGCSMADMAEPDQLEMCWSDLEQMLGSTAGIVPVTYINSSAAIKAFVGAHGGIVCTSTNAAAIMKWAWERGDKLLMLPDQHLGRWSGHQKGVALEEMQVWDPDEPMGGLTPEQIRDARILLWKGHCSVHQMFQPQHILRWREKNPSGMVISNPECRFDVCKLSDYVGSTDYIIKTVASSAPGTRWLVGTELNLVNRIAEQFKPQGKLVQFMAPTVCMCSTMARIDPQHFAWALENLVAGRVVNQIKVPRAEADLARIALDRMLAVS